MPHPTTPPASFGCLKALLSSLSSRWPSLRAAALTEGRASQLLVSLFLHLVFAAVLAKYPFHFHRAHAWESAVLSHVHQAGVPGLQLCFLLICTQQVLGDSHLKAGAKELPKLTHEQVEIGRSI